MAKLVALSVPLLLCACTHFVAVDTSHDRPVFSWPAGAGVTSLAVKAVAEDCESQGGKVVPNDEYRWAISGDIKPPVTYGKVPKGATETISAKPLTGACDTYVVTVGAGMQAESTTFSP